jgi:hypothetical protein
MPNSFLTTSILVVGVIFILTVVGLFIWTARKGNKINLTEPTDEKPEWMRSTPPKETIAATLAKGEGVQVFGYDEGEALASPFAEQIEDILQAKLAADPDLQKYKVDLGTGPDGLLEIDVNGVKYAGVNEIPDEKLKKLFKEAVAAWKKS